MYNSHSIFGNKGLSLERLDLLCRIAHSGGIRAAVGNDLSKQSLSSRQLKELSDYVGTALCRKNGRSLEMTNAGEELVAISTDFFLKLEAFLDGTRHLPRRFELGVGDSVFQWQILPRMKDFQRQCEGIQLQSYSYPASEIIKKVEARELDAGIVRLSALGPTELSVINIGEISYKLFVPLEDTSESGTTRQPAFRTLAFCTLTGDGEYARAMASFLATFNGKAALNCSSMTQMYAAVESRQYAAVLPANAEKNLPSDRILAYNLPELSYFTRTIALIHHTDAITNDNKRSTIDFLKTIIKGA